MQRLMELRKGGNVKRFHTMTMLREHLVSSHSWGVALNVIEIYPDASMRLMKAALYHDIAEFITGDVSAVTKWEYPAFAAALDEVEKGVEERLNINIKLMPFEQEILKVADMADLILCCLEEARLGNTEAVIIMTRALNWLNEQQFEFYGCNDFINQLNQYFKDLL